MTEPHDRALDELEAESVSILREVVATCERPVMLYSVGKDSSVLVRLAERAFHPGRIPFPLLHVDTGWKFPEMLAFREATAKRLGAQVIVHRNEPAIAGRANPWDLGTQGCCAQLKTQALLAALAKGAFDAAIGGARREEERARAKERVFSFRDRHGQWDPRNQRPEVFGLYNTRIQRGESLRAFPLSNWTELDVWHYVRRERIPVVPLYFAAPREVIVSGDQVMLASGIPEERRKGLAVETVMCRFRTLGCSPCTGAVRSTATTIEQIIEELSASKKSERAGRVIDHDADGSMEQKKREGYF